MRIDLVFPKLPPALDGIGDHTAHLAEALAAAGHGVRVLTAQEEADPIPGVRVERAFSMARRRGVHALLAPVEADPPDWLFVQYNPFSYGSWGLNLHLPFAVRRLQRASPDMKTAVMFHEDFMPATSLKKAVMSTWQRLQFRALVRLAEVAFFSIEPWTWKYEQRFPGRPVHHLPAGSNIPNTEANRLRERERLGVAPGAFVMGLFGSAHPSRLLSYVNAAASACTRELSKCRVLYVGRNGDQVRGALDASVALLDAGPLPAEDVSRCFAAMDLYLAPYRDGVSSRRGAFLAGLQHGIATVTTAGPDTDALLLEQREQAFGMTARDDPEAFAANVLRLARDEPRRAAFAEAGQTFFEDHFSWPRIAARLLRRLNEHDAQVAGVQ